MVQKYKPAIMDGNPVMIPDQQFGVCVMFSDYQMDLAQLANDNTKLAQKEQGNFFDELDRLEEANKKLHKQMKRLVEGLDDVVTGMSKRERQTIAQDYKDELEANDE